MPVVYLDARPGQRCGGAGTMGLQFAYMTPDTPPPSIDREALADVFRRVARVLNAVRPSIQADGGDVELVDVSADGLVRIRLHGACVGCVRLHP